MTDYSKTYSHLKKSESIINKKKFNQEHTIDNSISKQKSFLKMDKVKNDSKQKDNSGKKNHFMKKISANVSKNNKDKKRLNSHFDNDKYNNINKEVINNKKLTNSKSFNYEKNRNNKLNNSLNNKIIKRINDNSRNHKNFFDNYDKIKLRKKLMIKNRNNSYNGMNNTTTYGHNNNNITQINEQKFANSYFNTLFSKEENKKNDNEDNFFSLSQNMGIKKNNILRKINTNISINNDKYKKILLNDENEKEYNNRSQSNFYKKVNNNTYFSNYLFNNDYSNNNNNNKTETNNNEENNNINNHISNYDNNLQNNQPIKLYDDNHNTTINLAGSYNFHQYFNTIINNKNNSNNSNNRNDRKNIINRNYYRNNTTTENFSKIYNKVQYCQTQILNTNENDNKNNNIYISDIFNNNKIIEEINDIKDEMDKNLKQNPTNSKSKKYNTLKHSFEKLLKLFGEYFYNNDFNSFFIFLQKLLIGYHEVVSAFSSENRKLKELNYKLTEQYEKIDKNLIECNKIIKEKQNKIETLEKKLSGLMNNMNNINTYKKINNKKYEEFSLNNSFFNSFFDKNKFKEYIDMKKYDKEKNDQYNKIKFINESNLEDLDALYFFDKIEMKPQKSFSYGKIIPFLPINNLKK